MLWLNPKVVEKYNPSDFSELPADQRDELHNAVDGFLAVATRLRVEKPLTEDEFRQGLLAFRGVQAVARKFVLAEWADAAKHLIVEAEAWSAELGWRTRRDEKKLTESLLGQYQLQQLQIYAGQHLYVLDPIGRFVPGHSGHSTCQFSRRSTLPASIATSTNHGTSTLMSAKAFEKVVGALGQGLIREGRRELKSLL